MVFSSIIFLFFFLPIFLLAYVASGFSKNAILLFSLIFYAWGEPLYIALMLMMICFNYRFGIAIEEGHGYGTSYRWMSLGLVTNLLPLIVFKYGAFITNNTIAFVTEPIGLSQQPISVKTFGLPLGISFYTFHSLSYLIDVY